MAGLGPWLYLLLVLLPALICLLLLWLNLWSLVQMYVGAPTRRPIDVSDRRPRVALAALPWTSELMPLGFVRLGEATLRTPPIGLLNAVLRRSEQHVVWYFVDHQRTTLAEVPDVGVLVSLLSRLADGSFVLTMQPVGEDIDRPDLRVSQVRSSVADAYAEHRRQVQLRAVASGEPRAIATMDDYLAIDADYRQRHSRRVLRRLVVTRSLVPLSLMIIVLLLFALVTALWLRL